MQQCSRCGGNADSGRSWGYQSKVERYAGVLCLTCAAEYDRRPKPWVATAQTPREWMAGGDLGKCELP